MPIRISPSLQQKLIWWLTHYAVSAIIGCLMIGATFLPWISDALGTKYSAWGLPVDIGWQIHTEVFSYAVLCVFCAALVFLRILTHWRLRYDSAAQSQYSLVTKPLAILCFVPVLLLLFQYLFVDINAIDVLAQHETQMLLMQQHFGYNTLIMLLPLKPFTSTSAASGTSIVSSATLIGRLNLLVDVLGPGILLPIISGVVALCYCNMSNAPTLTDTPAPSFKERIRKNWLIWLVSGLFFLVVFGRAPGAMASEYQAKQALSVGDYNGAERWLSSAVTLNPALSQAMPYHLELGRAEYYIQPAKLTDNAHLYLASVYSSQNDYLDAYSELLTVWSAHSTDNMPWLKEQFSMTLEWLAEFSQHSSSNVTQYGSDGLPLENGVALRQSASGLLQDNSGSSLLNNNNTVQSVNALAQASSPLSPENNTGVAQTGGTGAQQASMQQSSQNNTLAPVIPRSDGDFEAVPWLAMLSEVDSSNIYDQYVLGREFYTQNAFDACIEYMQNVIYTNSNPAIKSSAETYIGLSLIKQGQVAQGRQYLLQATKLDVNFNNNTAREELSGLH